MFPEAHYRSTWNSTGKSEPWKVKFTTPLHGGGVVLDILVTCKIWGISSQNLTQTVEMLSSEQHFIVIKNWTQVTLTRCTKALEQCEQIEDI